MQHPGSSVCLSIVVAVLDQPAADIPVAADDPVRVHVVGGVSDFPGEKLET